MKNANSSSTPISRLLLFLLLSLSLLGVICVYAQEESIGNCKTAIARNGLSVHRLRKRRPRGKKGKSQVRKSGSRIWCKCLGKVVTRRRQCRCPKVPRITPFPTIPPRKPGRTRRKFWCKCSNVIIDVKTKDECLSRSKECEIVDNIVMGAAVNRPNYECACLNRKVRTRKQCCNCESRKCKCWSNWWRDWQYRRHLAFKNCNRVCRRRKC